MLQIRLGQKHFCQSDNWAKDILTKFTTKITFQPKTFWLNKRILFDILEKLGNKKKNLLENFGQNVIGQNVTYLVDLTKTSLAKFSLPQMSLAQKYSSQNVFIPTVKNLW